MRDACAVFYVCFKGAYFFTIVLIETVVSANPHKAFIILSKAAYVILRKSFFNGNVAEARELGNEI